MLFGLGFGMENGVWHHCKEFVDSVCAGRPISGFGVGFGIVFSIGVSGGSIGWWSVVLNVGAVHVEILSLSAVGCCCLLVVVISWSCVLILQQSVTIPFCGVVIE